MEIICETWAEVEKPEIGEKNGINKKHNSNEKLFTLKQWAVM